MKRKILVSNVSKVLSMPLVENKKLNAAKALAGIPHNHPPVFKPGRK
jgi:hypothetical protein